MEERKEIFKNDYEKDEKREDLTGKRKDVQKRKNYKIWCKEERRHEKEEERKIKSICTEKEAWRYINKYKRKRKGIDEGIKLETWKTPFMDLLGEKEQRII